MLAFWHRYTWYSSISGVTNGRHQYLRIMQWTTLTLPTSPPKATASLLSPTPWWHPFTMLSWKWRSFATRKKSSFEDDTEVAIKQVQHFSYHNALSVPYTGRNCIRQPACYFEKYASRLSALQGVWSLERILILLITDMACSDQGMCWNSTKCTEIVTNELK